MPRKASKERFTSVSIEQKTKDIVMDNRYPNEPIYNVFYRMACIYNKSELSDAHSVIEDYQQLLQRKTQKIKDLEDKIQILEAQLDQYEGERRIMHSLERYT